MVCHLIKVLKSVICSCPLPWSRQLIDVNLPEFSWTVYVDFNGINSLLRSVCSTPHLEKSDVKTNSIRAQITNYPSIHWSIHPSNHCSTKPVFHPSIHLIVRPVTHPSFLPSYHPIIHPCIFPSITQLNRSSIHPLPARSLGRRADRGKGRCQAVLAPLHAPSHSSYRPAVSIENNMFSSSLTTSGVMANRIHSTYLYIEQVM